MHELKREPARELAGELARALEEELAALCREPTDELDEEILRCCSEEGVRGTAPFMLGMHALAPKVGMGARPPKPHVLRASRCPQGSVFPASRMRTLHGGGDPLLFRTKPFFLEPGLFFRTNWKLVFGERETFYFELKFRNTMEI